MGFGTAIHYFGTLLLLVGAILMIVASVSPPTVRQLPFLKVHITNSNSISSVDFGAFGWCVGGGGCTSSHVGYNPEAALLQYAHTDYFGTASKDSVKALTNVFVLHPIAAAVTFIAFLFSLKTGFLAICTTLIALLGFLITVVCVAVDFATFAEIKHKVNSNSDANSAVFGDAIWCVLAAAVATLAGAIIIFITCCAGRRRSRYENRKSTY